MKKIDTRAVTLLCIFALTGVAAALPGAILPAMIRHWNMSDRRAGVFLLLSWSGSTCGAFFARGRLQWSVARGVALCVIAMLLLAAAGRSGALSIALLYGTGLGITMTSISILRSRTVGPTQRSQEMNRLNTAWAIGAFVTPFLAMRTLHTLNLAVVFLAVAGLFSAALASLLWTWRTNDSDSLTENRAPQTQPEPYAPLRLCLLAACAVGVESSLNGWLTTFASRSTHSAGLAVSVNSAFWGGLLLSRAIHASSYLRWLRSFPGILAHMAVAFIATALLVFHPLPIIFLVIALLCGVGLGPLYPSALSIALPRYRSIAVFISAGVASAVFPWLTGTVSTVAGSLRAGLIVPCGVALVLLGTGSLLKRDFAEAVT